MRRRALIGRTAAGLLAVPFAAHAQKTANAVAGLLTPVTFDAEVLDALRKGLSERGYVEGRNLTLVSRSAEGQLDRLPALAAELVARKVSVIMGVGGPLPARSAKAVTATIPIVFAYGGDPVIDGLVASFNRPGGNVTGATFIGTSLIAKRFQLLRELLPRMAEVALLVNRKSTLAEPQIKDAETAANAMGLRLRVVEAGTAAEIDTAFETINQAKVDALVLTTDPTFGLIHTKQIIASVMRYKIPSVHPTKTETTDGALMSYGASFNEAVRQAAVYAGRILDGEKPADLPVLQPTTFELIINLKTARALGLTVPPSLLAVADQVIE
jgi:putative tryptophan/tyrosine transport system substrate-binding protein